MTPPINEIPNGDWFCAHCSSILEKSLSVKPSDENEFCDEVVVDDSIVDGSDVENIDDDDDDETLDLEDLDDIEDDAASFTVEHDKSEEGCVVVHDGLSLFVTDCIEWGD